MAAAFVGLVSGAAAMIKIDYNSAAFRFTSASLARMYTGPSKLARGFSPFSIFASASAKSESEGHALEGALAH